MTNTTPCAAAVEGNGYWTCDVVGGCRDCRRLAQAIEDYDTLDEWRYERETAYK